MFWNIIKTFVTPYCNLVNWYYGKTAVTKSDSKDEPTLYTAEDLQKAIGIMDAYTGMGGISTKEFSEAMLLVAKKVGEPTSLIPIIQEFLGTGECKICGIKLKPDNHNPNKICFGCKQNKTKPYESVVLTIKNPRIIIKSQDPTE